MEHEPAFAFVPGGRWPRPAPNLTSAVAAIGGGRWWDSPAYVRGVELFNAGYYWEAHEAWESLWHAHGRAGPIADVLKGLIKLAAAGVKVRQRQQNGVVTHTRRAADCFERARSAAGARLLGLDLEWLGRIALEIAAEPPADPGSIDARVTKVFAFELVPSTENG